MTEENAKRAANALLQVGDIWSDKQRWLPCVEEARSLLGVTGLARPAGLPADGELALNHYMVAANGLVKWTVRYRFPGSSTWTTIGGFVTDYLPDEARCTKPKKPIRTHGLTVLINQKVSGHLARPVRVLVDELGLPVPLPPEVWNALGL